MAGQKAGSVAFPGNVGWRQIVMFVLANEVQLRLNFLISPIEFLLWFRIDYSDYPFSGRDASSFLFPSSLLNRS